MAIDSVDVEDDELQLARERLFGCIELLRNNPPATLTKTKQMIGLIRRMLDEAKNLNIIDFEFTLGLGSFGLGAFESSLKPKKIFLSSKKKHGRNKQNTGLEIDLNVHAAEYEPFQFQYLNKRGCPRSNKAAPMVPGASLEDLPPFQHAQLVDNSPIDDVQDGSQASLWCAVGAQDPMVKEAAGNAVKIIQERSNSWMPYEHQEIVSTKRKVVN